MTVLTVIAVAAMLTGVAILAVLLVAAQVVDHHARRLPRDPWWTWDADEHLRDVQWESKG